MNLQGQKRIFIVEDNFMYSYLLGEVLSEYGSFHITPFASGKECIDLLDNDPDLVILDYNLADGINGMETFRIIHHKKPDIPVIVLSGQTDVQVAADLLKEGAFDYIEKKNKEAAMEKLRTSILKALK